jgi:hypothetical protein
MGSKDPRRGGARWWMYQRSALASGPGHSPRVVEEARGDDGVAAHGTEPSAGAVPSPHRPTSEWEDLGSGAAGGTAAAALLVLLVLSTRVLGYENLGVIIFPVVGIVGAVAFGKRCRRLHADEPWLPRMLLLGVAAKLVASWFRWVTLTQSYGGVGDATEYDKVGRSFVSSWVHGAKGPDLTNLRQTNFIRWFTGVVYFLFGQNLLAGFLLFGLIAIVGSYFWYRAFITSVPMADGRLFLLFMMFAPSVVFWPSSLGKEALMQLGVGAMAWATALLVTGRFYRALPLMCGGGWLLWVVRPHLLALVAVAGAVPYFVGRVRSGQRAGFLGRPAGMVVIGLVVVLTITSGAKYLGVSDLSVESLDTELNQQTERTAQGGSSFSHGENSLNPVHLPWGLVTVLFRPFPWETLSGFQLLAALESMAVIALIVLRFGSLRTAFQYARKHPFLLYCMVALVLYGMTFSSFANFGLLNRQRSLVLPALYALIAVIPTGAPARGSDADPPHRSRDSWAVDQ